MASQLKVIEPVQTDLALQVANNPGIVLLDSEKFNVWYEKLRAKAPENVDIATKKGRDQLRSFAAEVRSEKAAINKARLSLTAEWRDMTAQANEQGKIIGEKLESLAVEVRKPLTDWEAAEEARVAECERMIVDMDIASIIAPEDTAATVRDRGMVIWNAKLDADRFGELFDKAKATKDATVATLKAALARLTLEEADRAELAKLRKQQQERETAEAQKLADEQAKREADEAARIAEERRIAAEKTDAERIRQAEEKAAQAARDEAAKKAAAELAEREAKHAAELKAERDKAAEAERAAQAITLAAQQQREYEAAEAKRVADEQAELDRNKAHRTKVKRAAKEAFMTCGASEETAQKIVLAILAGEVPRVTLAFTA